MKKSIPKNLRKLGKRYVDVHRFDAVDGINYVQVSFHGIPILVFCELDIRLYTPIYDAFLNYLGVILRLNQASNQFNLHFRIFRKNSIFRIRYKSSKHGYKTRVLQETMRLDRY